MARTSAIVGLGLGCLLALGCGGDEPAHASSGGGGGPPPAPAHASAPPPSSGGGGGGGGGFSGGGGDYGGSWAAAARVAGHGGGLGSQVFAADEAHRLERIGPERLDGHDREEDEAIRLHAALTATTAIVDPQDDDCEQHWDRMQAGLEAFRRQHEGEGTAADQPPAVTQGRDQYLRHCRSQPAAQRQCLAPDYEAAHADECQRLADAQEREGQALARHARAGDLAAVASPTDPHPTDVRPPRHADDLMPELPSQ